VKRNGTELILVTKSYAKDSTLLSWWCILSTSFLFLAAMSGALFLTNPWLRVLCSVMQGLLTLRLFVIYHDQQHHAILPKSRLAEGLMRVFGIYTLSASSIWRSSHNHHHNHNSKLRGSHIGSYPIMTKTQFAKSSPGARFQYLFIRHPATILFGYLFMFIFGMCINPLMNNFRKHWDCLISLLAHIGLGIFLWVRFDWQTMVLVQTIPHLVASAIGSYLFYAQHNFPGVTFAESGGWTYEKAALESSSFLKTGPIMQWFSANIGFHHVHHLNSKIPFYRLPEVVREVPELQNPKTTSLSPMEIIRCLRLKVWDSDLQKMVPLSKG
jgi:omega-6 fatty acid desaturase (delta-12 desaturase)